MSIRALLAALVVVAVLIGVVLALQAGQRGGENRLVIVGPAGIGDLGRELARRFSERYGVNATFVALGGAVEMVNELVRAGESPPWDVAIGIPEFYYRQLVDRGLLYCFKPANLGEIPSGEVWDPSGCVYPLDKSYIGIVYNATLLGRLGVPPPSGLDDLLRPEYRGLVTYPSPVTSGTGLAVLAWVMSVKGEGEGWRYLKALSANVARLGYPTGFTPLRNALKRGEVAVALSWYSHAIDPGTPHMRAVTSSAFLYREGLAVLRNARHRDLAVKFVEFALSKEGQDLVDPYNYMLPVRPDALVKNNQGLPQPQSVVVYDQALGAKADEWRLRWQREVAGG